MPYRAISDKIFPLILIPDQEDLDREWLDDQLVRNQAMEMLTNGQLSLDDAFELINSTGMDPYRESSIWCDLI